MRDLTVASPALGEMVKVRLLLPVHYSARPGGRWPVLYLLHGCCDTYQSWTRSTDVEALTAHSDVLVVMPDGGKAGFYSDWLTGPRGETFHLTELRRILERDYRASTVMAVAGVSMGGLGALAYAARHPGLFRAAASFSGIVDTRLTQRESMRYVDLVRSQGEGPQSAVGRSMRGLCCVGRAQPVRPGAQTARHATVRGGRHRAARTAGSCGYGG